VERESSVADPKVADPKAADRMTGRALIAAGVLCLLVGGWGSAQYRSALARAPLLRQPSGIAVDRAGRIYCGVAGSRIHVYDVDGRILRVWPVEAGGRPLRIALVGPAEEPRVEVAPPPPAEVQVYDTDGDLLDRRSDPGAFERFGDESQWAAVGPDGARYRFEGTALMRDGGEGTSVVVAAIPLPLRWFADSPWLLVAVFLMGPIGVFAGMVHQARAIRR
jgi:hypothetical protein